MSTIEFGSLYALAIFGLIPFAGMAVAKWLR
jgi:hypothetical protein